MSSSFQNGYFNVKNKKATYIVYSIYVANFLLCLIFVYILLARFSKSSFYKASYSLPSRLKFTSLSGTNFVPFINL